ncbi:RNA polymerase sigma factor [Pseudoroseomonas globiformis]|uniref:RNA polymerase sigma factor n=1 Tax=Teichococcus globiformis TaxID=2307229 RepID=A0ABV7G495_9PROT
MLPGLLPRLRRFALGLCRSPDEADDLVQAACERALTASLPSEGLASPEAWMFRILRNLWLDRMRRRRTRGEEVDVETRHDLPAMGAELAPARRIALRRAAVAIGELPEEQRSLMLLVCVEELSYRQAAEILDLPIGTVMSRLARARRTVAERVGADATEF